MIPREKRREQWRKASRRYTQRHPERRIANTKKYRETHAAQVLEASRKMKLKYRLEGRCPRCGHKLIDGEKIYCINCGSVAKGEFAYAKSCQGLAKEVRDISR